MNEIVVRSIDGSGSLTLSEPLLTAMNEYRWAATLIVDGESSGVELKMITPYRMMWLEYVRGLADDIAGWEGRRAWQSEFGELSLVCSSGGVPPVEPIVRLWGPGLEDGERSETLLIRSEDVVRLGEKLPDFLQLPSELL